MLPFTACLPGISGGNRNFLLVTRLPVTILTGSPSGEEISSNEGEVSLWNGKLSQTANNSGKEPSTNLGMEDSLQSLDLLSTAVGSNQENMVEKQIRPCWFHSGRFLTLHKRRKKRPPTRAMSSDQALLDDLYLGPTHILLERISEWPFNAFALDRSTGGRPLPTLCFHLFHHYGLVNHFCLDPVKVWKFFSLVEEGYHSNNPYHNAIHATDVTQAMHCFLQEQKMRTNLTPLEIASSLIAAMAHDLDHPGVNQPFLVATSNHLASLYKNASVLENHHWRSAMACLMESGMMDGLDSISARELQRQIQSLILATDIARQQEFLAAFQTHLNENTLDLRNADHRHFMLQIALKCADISNPCRPWALSRAWSLQVSEEFYRQGDLERRLGLPVTPLCDRYSSSVSKIQTGFFRFIAAPLFEEWHRFHSTTLSLNMLNYLRSNKLKWDAILSREESGDMEPHGLWQPSKSYWPELGIMESGIERFHLRRASLPAGRSGLWASKLAGCRKGIDVVAQRWPGEEVEAVDNCDAITTATECSRLLTGTQGSPYQQFQSTPHPFVAETNHGKKTTPFYSNSQAEMFLVLPTRLPQRRESLPYDFPDRSRKESWSNQGRRESLPSECSGSILNVDDILPKLNITSMAPVRSILPPKREKRSTITFSTNSSATTATPSTPLSNCVKSPTSVAFIDEKENIDATAVSKLCFLQKDPSRLTLRRGSAPTALHPLNAMDNQRGKRGATTVSTLGRQGSLRLSHYPDKSEPGLRRRGSLPYELCRKLSGQICEPVESKVLFPTSTDCSSKLDVRLRRGSAPSDLLRNTGASITSYFSHFRDRIRMKENEVAVNDTGLGLICDPGSGYTGHRCRSLRRRKSGGPELFTSVVRRGSNNFVSTQLPPLPHSVTYTHIKLKRTSSLSPPESICTPTGVGFGDTHRDWLLLGRRGSGALELLAGLWRQTRDRSTLDADDPLFKRYHQRPSIDSSTSSDGLPCSAFEEYCHWVGPERIQRRGSCPVDNSPVLVGTSPANLVELNRR